MSCEEQVKELERKLAKANAYLESEVQAKREWFDKMLKVRVERDNYKGDAARLKATMLNDMVHASQLTQLEEENDTLRARLHHRHIIGKSYEVLAGELDETCH